MARASRVLLAVGLAFLTGCAETVVDEAEEGASSDLSSTDGVLYFHGMSHLGIAPAALKHAVGDRDLLAPSLTDAQLEAPPSSAVLAFLRGHSLGIVSGYSLGRVPVLRLMKSGADGMTRVVMIDPTYDTAGGMGSSIGGPTARTWLDAHEGRSFLLVYGDTTKELGGQQSYVTALGHHARAEICYIPGEHERFRAADMAYAMVATDCADLKAHLTP
jgi:hypothetical protein